MTGVNTGLGNSPARPDPPPKVMAGPLPPPPPEYEFCIKSNVLKYKPLLLSHARKGLMAAAQVEAMDYASVAAACKVTIEENGDSPSDFFYQSVRIHVVNVLRQEQAAAEREDVQGTMEALVASSPLLKKYGISIDVDGTHVEIPPTDLGGG